MQMQTASQTAKRIANDFAKTRGSCCDQATLRERKFSG
jgi:hypothetical protein